VEINLAALKDETARRGYDTRATELLRECAEFKTGALEAVRGIIWRGSR